MHTVYFTGKRPWINSEPIAIINNKPVANIKLRLTDKFHKKYKNTPRIKNIVK